MSKPLLKVQSFGAGVQSVALLRLALAGRVPKPDLVIFADTKQEPEHVYDVVLREQEVCRAEGIRFEVVSNGDLGDLESNRTAKEKRIRLYVPTYIRGNGQSEKVAMLLRSCTENFKIRPIRRFLRNNGYKGAYHIEMALGISTDEVQRMKPSPVQWVEHTFPLIDAGLSRADCLEYLASLGIQAAKSACVFCPYRDNKSWLELKSNSNDWQRAVDYDRQIRDSVPHLGQVFVHRSGVPLEEADLHALPKVRKRAEAAEPSFDDECSGHCGL